MFTVIPAIDILNGNTVRLKKGDYAQKTSYANSPLVVAKKWASLGAKRIHIVDLDGAKKGQPFNDGLIKEIAKVVNCTLEVGGGIRTMEQIKKYLDAGVEHIILGSVIFKDKKLLTDAVKKYGEHIIGGIDLSNGQVKISGWLENTNKDGLTAISALAKIGLSTIIVTDISKDGMLSGPNLELYKNISEKSDIKIIASGGITTIEDIKKVKKIDNLVGCIIGKALYENKIDLKAALALEE